MYMKRAGRFFALLMLAAVMLAAPWAAQTAVVDVKEKLKPPKPVWEGVLSVAVVPSFPTLNLNGWLGACSRDFEKQEGNVLVSLREMTQEGVLTGAAAGNLPDILLFGAGVFNRPQDLLTRMRGAAAVKPGLSELGSVGGERYAVPLAMGGYCLLGNRSLLDGAGWSPNLTMGQTLELIKEKDLAVASPAMPYTQPLTAFEQMGETSGIKVDSEREHTKIWPDFALEKKYAFYVATQREVRRMATLQSAGKGFDTVILTPEEPVYVDQVLLGGMVDPKYSLKSDDALYRAEWAGRLFSFLLTDEMQLRLSQAGLFPATQVEGVYDADTQMGVIERSLQGELQCAEAFR